MCARLKDRCGLREAGATFAAAAAVGVVWALAFPRIGIAGVGWVAPGLLAWVGLGVDGRRCFQLGYVAGLAHFFVSLSWLLNIPFPAGALAAWLALGAFLALFPAVWLWWVWKVSPCGGGGGGPGRVTIGMLLGVSWARRLFWGLRAAAGWTVLEWVRGWIFGGFPLNYLGASQWGMLPVAQWASVTGVYGVSFLMVWFSMGLVFGLWALAGRPSERWGWQREVVIPFLAVCAVVGFGFGRLAQRPVVVDRVRLALVQPSIPQVLIWDPKEQPARFQRLMELSEAAVREHPDVLVWPEAAMPSLSFENMVAITNLIAANRVWMVFGADDFEPKEGEAGVDAYNASFLFGPDGRHVATYRKQRLVMFGEFVPLARWFPFLRRLTPIEGLAAGSGPVTFEVGGRGVRCSVLICFEDLFPALARQHASLGVEFLLNLTNDGWFGEASGQWQHAASAVFRAIETGMPLVRATNNGLTCWADAYGRVEQIFRAGDGGVYGSGHLEVSVPVGERGGGGVRTIYREWGDWFIGLCGVLCLRVSRRPSTRA